MVIRHPGVTWVLQISSLLLLLFLTVLVIQVTLHPALRRSEHSFSSTWTVSLFRPEGDVPAKNNSNNNNINNHIHEEQQHPQDEEDAQLLEPVYQLINRLVQYNHSRRDFQLKLLRPLPSVPITKTHTNTSSSLLLPCELPCFIIQDHCPPAPKQQSQQRQQQSHDDCRISIQGGPTFSELTAGIGWYFRHVAHMPGLDLWPLPPPLAPSTTDHANRHRNTSGSSNNNHTLRNQDPWSIRWLGDGVVMTHHRVLPYSYLMNVCTHSYSLVWYTAAEWIRFIDWMALSGINLMLALTGQEWIQYQVFTTLGLSDSTIRQWFNGPAFLTWSRGQNEYGSNIGGPLPLSWMKDQWRMQKDIILPLIRSLDIVGQLPAFQGNVPKELLDLYPHSNMTIQGETGWIDSLDPLFGQVADLWMEFLLHDFGPPTTVTTTTTTTSTDRSRNHWYQLDGYFNGGTAPWSTSSFSSSSSSLSSTLKQPTSHTNSSESSGSMSHIILDHDETWYQRGVQAYQGINRTDPAAIWSFQGFAFVGWDTPEQASFLKGFVDSVPSNDKFVIMDMSYDPEQPEWAKWNQSAFFGASFIWNVLHNFGGTDGIKGDFRKVNRMPFDALNISEQAHPIGLGATPEGITQNPVYYQFLFEQPFFPEPRTNLTVHMIRQMHHRYGVDPDTDFEPEIAMSWALLLRSLYSTDRSVQDGTAVGHWSSSRRSSLFMPDRYTPTDLLCQVAGAWDHLLQAAQKSRQYGLAFHKSRAFQYDLVNLGREVLAQLSTPMALNFSDAVSATTMDPVNITLFGNIYRELLLDLDTLVDTDDSFRLERWLRSARSLGKNSTDCELPVALDDDGTPVRIPNGTTSCEIFYEWNARCQVTTWNPTLVNAVKVPDGPIDYAAKHWSGLIREYYVKRVALVQAQALEDAATNQPMNQTRLDQIVALHAYQWTLLEAFRLSPDDSTERDDNEGSYIDVSENIFSKYKHWFLAPFGCLDEENVNDLAMA